MSSSMDKNITSLSANASAALHEPQPVEARYDGDIAHDSYYYTGFWSVYKGVVKGLLGGLAIGSGLGSILGAAACGIIVAVTTVTFTWPLLGACVLGMGAVTALIGMHEGSFIGGVAGQGGIFDEAELRNSRERKAENNRILRLQAAMLGKEDTLRQIAPDAFQPVAPLTKDFISPEDGPHVAASTTPNTHFFHWKTALIGILVGAAVGALIMAGLAVALPWLAAGAGGLIAANSGLALAIGAVGQTIFHVGGHAAVQATAGVAAHGVAHAAAGGLGAALSAAAPAIAAGSAVTALLGSSFGIPRYFYRKAYDFTDHLFSGEIFAKSHAASMNPSLTREKSSPKHHLGYSLSSSSTVLPPSRYFSDAAPGPVHNTATRISSDNPHSFVNHVTRNTSPVEESRMAFAGDSSVQAGIISSVNRPSSSKEMTHILNRLDPTQSRMH